MQIFTQSRNFKQIQKRRLSIFLILFVFFGTINISRADTYGLIDEPPMQSANVTLHNISSIRVEVFLDNKWQILAGQGALNFLILRSYVVHDNTAKSGYRTTDKYKQWENANTMRTKKPVKPVNPLKPVKPKPGKEWVAFYKLIPGSSSNLHIMQKSAFDRNRGKFKYPVVIITTGRNAGKDACRILKNKNGFHDGNYVNKRHQCK